MADTPNIEDLVRKLTDAIPSGIKELETEAKKQFRTVLETGLSKMEMVTREEFDIQTKVLAKTREKVDILEQRLTDLENREPL